MFFIWPFESTDSLVKFDRYSMSHSSLNSFWCLGHFKGPTKKKLAVRKGEIQFLPQSASWRLKINLLGQIQLRQDSS